MNTPLILENSSKPQFLNTKGRIGRVRLLAWTSSLALTTIAGILVLAWLATTVVRDLSGLLLIAGLVIVQILSMLLIIRRLHDLNRSGWFCLLVLIPWLGYLFILLLMLVPGNRSSNRFGPAPAPNSIGERILACLWPLLILGLIGVSALKTTF
ncbi:DUF805 domain-containing protein [Pseudomonas sp. UM16]|uniref:DUF805 domain-containing protein n=1 Tax=Pseudomonas sp. UM16 TaxID=3158962 RepID=UPI00398FF113